MQLTRAADYAVRVMIHLATLPPEIVPKGISAGKPRLAPVARFRAFRYQCSFPLGSAHRDLNALNLATGVQVPMFFSIRGGAQVPERPEPGDRRSGTNALFH